MAASPSSPSPLRYHWLRLRAVAHPTEDPGKVAAAMRSLSGLDEDAFDAATKRLAFDAHHGGTTTVFETDLTRSRQVRDVLDRLLDGRRDALAQDVERRVGDDGVWTLRFDKQEALAGRIASTDGEAAVQVRLRMMVHPATREGAVEAVRALLAARRS